MISTILWLLPVPSTALLDAGPVLHILLRREIELRFSHESADDTVVSAGLVFQGVEAFKVTYYQARDASMRAAYDKLVDRGRSAWLEEVCQNLSSNGGRSGGLVHLMINFDDGPAYEAICVGFRIAAY